MIIIKKSLYSKKTTNKLPALKLKWMVMATLPCAIGFVASTLSINGGQTVSLPDIYGIILSITSMLLGAGLLLTKNKDQTSALADHLNNI